MRRVKKGFGRDATAIEADTAETFVAFDEDDFFAEVCSVEGGGVTAGAGAHNNDFGFGWVHFCFLLVLVLGKWRA